VRRLLIRPGAIGDFIVSLPVLESLRADYTEVWCTDYNVPLVRFADHAQSIVSSGLDRVGILPAEEVIAKLATFDSIISWYGTNRPDFREFVRDLRFEFRPALPDGACHAIEFYGSGRFPHIPVPEAARTFAAIHPFASSAVKRAPIEIFRRLAAKLAETMPVQWLAGPEEELQHAVRIDNLYHLACWLRQAKIFIGNDSGISHLAAAVGTPVLALFQASDSRVWSPRGVAVHTINSQLISCGKRL
jgi:heptosyltransferase III